MAPTLFKLDIASALKFSMYPVNILAIFADMFDTIGTLVGVASRNNMIDEKGNLERGNRALFVDFIV